MSFFIRRRGARQRGGSSGGVAKATASGRKRARLDAEEIESSDSDDGSARSDASADAAMPDDQTETLQERKLRLANAYVQQLKRSGRLDDDAVSKVLHEQSLEESGRLRKQISSQLLDPATYSADCRKELNGHRLAPSCVCFSSDSRFLYSGSKDGAIIKWTIDGQRLIVRTSLPNAPAGSQALTAANNTVSPTKGKHLKPIYALAISYDDKYLVSGGADAFVHVWSANDVTLLKSLSGHRAPVSGLCFGRSSLQLFSASMDRCIKVWTLAEMAYMESLFGHQDGAQAIDSCAQDRCLTAGGRDRTLRLWKIVEESHLIFNASGGSVDCVAMLDAQHFASGGDDNTIALWLMSKKRPTVIVREAHAAAKGHPTWVTALCAPKGGDLVISGSTAGDVCLWAVGSDYRSLNRLYSLSVGGVVNALAVSGDLNSLAVARGQEPRMGRWIVDKTARNRLLLCKLLYRQHPIHAGAPSPCADHAG